MVVKNSSGRIFKETKLRAAKKRNNDFDAEPITKTIHLFIFFLRVRYLNKYTNKALLTQINGIRYIKKTVNGPNNIPLESIPNEGAIMIGRTLYPLILKEDNINMEFTIVPTNS